MSPLPSPPSESQKQSPLEVAEKMFDLDIEAGDLSEQLAEARVEEQHSSRRGGLAKTINDYFGRRYDPQDAKLHQLAEMLGGLSRDTFYSFLVMLSKRTQGGSRAPRDRKILPSLDEMIRITQDTLP